MNLTSTAFVVVHGALAEFSELDTGVAAVTAVLTEIPPLDDRTRAAVDGLGWIDDTDGRRTWSVDLDVALDDWQQATVQITRFDRGAALAAAEQALAQLIEGPLSGEFVSKLLCVGDPAARIPAVITARGALPEAGDVTITAGHDTLLGALRLLRHVAPGVTDDALVEI